MGWRDNPVIRSVEKPEIKYCFSGLVLAGKAWSKISLPTNKIWKRGTQQWENRLGTNKGSWTCSTLLDAERVGQCDWEKAVPHLWKNIAVREGENVMLRYFIYQVKKETGKRNSWLKTVNKFSKDSSDLANLISFCDEMTGYMDKDLHVIFVCMCVHVFYHYICSPIQLWWLWSHMLENEFHNSFI